MKDGSFADREIIEQLEIIFELLRMEERAATAKMKRKTGRPKKRKPEQRR